MRPTRIRVLLALAAVTAAAGWGVARVVEALTARLVPVPWLAPATLWLLAAAVFVWALLSRPRLLRRPGARPMPPLVAARTAALAMASSRVGAVVGGLYAGLAIAALPAMSVPAGQETAAAAGAAAMGAVALVAAALWLEHMCRITEDGDDPPGGARSRPVPEPGTAAGDGGSWPAPAARSDAGSRRAAG
jgi:hypothetical protein